MGKIISIANLKGGVGKTTTAVNLSACLAELGRRTLLVDLDPQGNAGSGAGVDRRQVNGSVYHVLLAGVPVTETIVATPFSLLEVVPSTIDLVGIEVEMVAREGREFLLRNALRGVADRYDFVIIDSPPALGLLTLNALAAGESVIVPVQCEYYALEGLSQLLRTIHQVKRRINPDLTIEGLLLTMYDSRTLLSQRVVQEVRQHFGPLAFHTVIPRNVRLSEAPSFGKPVTAYDGGSRGAAAYRELARELLEHGENHAG